MFHLKSREKSGNVKFGKKSQEGIGKSNKKYQKEKNVDYLELIEKFRHRKPLGL